MDEKKRVLELKNDCHDLLEKIWGSGTSGKAQAYIWLANQYGKPIHFSEIDDPQMLSEIKQRLESRFNQTILSELLLTAEKEKDRIFYKSSRRNKNYVKNSRKHRRFSFRF